VMPYLAPLLCPLRANSVFVKAEEKIGTCVKQRASKVVPDLPLLPITVFVGTKERTGS
jgi:hypothetical protein